MYYYQFNIGDYQSHTSHLNEMEDLAYRRLLDWCYLHEKPLPDDVDEIARQIRMRMHCECIANVLQEYFQRTTDGWVSQRVTYELSLVSEKSEKARAAAEVRWAKKSSEIKQVPAQSDGDANAMHEQCERNAIQRHKDTNTQIKKENKKEKVQRPHDIAEQVWSDFLQMRKAKQAPLTETALKTIQREASKAGMTMEQVLMECVNRGWRGFKADWVGNPPANQFKSRYRPNNGAGVAIFGDLENEFATDTKRIDP